MNNRKLLKKYPWLSLNFNPLSGRVWKLSNKEKYYWTWWSQMPRGWKIAFGNLILEDLDRAIKKMSNPREFYITEIKEKYGELRIYHTGNRDVEDVVEAYTALSRNICLHCGKPDVGYTTGGWITPICKQCWDKAEIYGKYETSICDPEDWKMASQRRYSTYKDGEKKEIIVDISDYAEKVRIRYARRNMHRD